MADTHILKQELGSVIEEYAVVRPDFALGAANGSGNGLTLGLRGDLSRIIEEPGRELVYSGEEAAEFHHDEGEQ